MAARTGVVLKTSNVSRYMRSQSMKAMLTKRATEVSQRASAATGYPAWVSAPRLANDGKRARVDAGVTNINISKSGKDRVFVIGEDFSQDFLLAVMGR